MQDNIVLTGLPGSGKTTVGKTLAKVFNMYFIDFDEVIERGQKMPIKEIFAHFGEEHFRNLETDLILNYKNSKNTVFSTGGGIVKREENIVKLKKIGKIFYLKAEPKIIYERLKGDLTRPLLQVQNPLKEIEKLYHERKSNYEKADFIIESTDKTADKIAEEIYAKVNR